MIINHLITIVTLLILNFAQGKPTTSNKGAVGAQQGLARSTQPFKRSLCSTNAECLRKGLPLIKPVRRGTKTRALKPRQSDSPEIISGSIQAFDTDGNSLGYIARFPNDDGGYDITTNPSEAISISFTEDGNNPFSIVISSEDRQGGYPYLGAVFNGSPGSDMRAEGARYFTLLSGISEYKSGPGTSSVDNNGEPNGEGNTRGLYGAEETSIFLYNSDSQEITGQWTNPDNSKTNTIFFLGSTSKYGFGMIHPANYQAFKNGLYTDPQIMTLKYITSFPPPEKIDI